MEARNQDTESLTKMNAPAFKRKTVEALAFMRGSKAFRPCGKKSG